MRIRQKAQFELVNRNKSQLLWDAVAQQGHQLMRVHGIWGLGQLIAKGEDLASDLIPYLSDEDAEIIAQAAKVLGDVKFVTAGSHLIPLLSHQNSRVKFYAAQALGRIKDENAVNDLIQMLVENNDEDV